MPVNRDPILEKLREISEKQDLTIANQNKLDAHLSQIHDDCRRTARTNGAVAGGLAGGLVSVGIALIKAKFGG